MVEVCAELVGSVWKIRAAVGDVTQEDDVLLVLESMKMEVPVLSPVGGSVLCVLVSEGDAVVEGQVLVRIGGEG